MTRAEICRHSGFPRSTVSLNCDQLIRTGLLTEQPVMHGVEVSKRTRVGINGSAGYIIGIELGATGCEIGISDLSAKLIATDSGQVDLSRGPDPVMFQIHDRIRRLMEENGLARRPAAWNRNGAAYTG